MSETEGTDPSLQGKRGFASMEKAKRVEIAKLGGRAVPNNKRSFSQNKVLARQAGRKGGLTYRRVANVPMSKIEISD